MQFKYNQMIQSVKRTDRDFHRTQIETTEMSEANQYRLKQRKFKLAEETAMERVADYLTVTELLQIYSKQLPIKYEDVTEHKYPIKSDNRKEEEQHREIFAPQINALQEWVPISASTIKRYLPTIHKVYFDYTVKKHPEFDFSKEYSDDIMAFFEKTVYFLRDHCLLNQKDIF